LTPYGSRVRIAGLRLPCGCSYRIGQVAKQSAREAREWDEAHGKLVDLPAFEREILRLIQDVPLSGLQNATTLSLRYVSLIRRGARMTIHLN
jgi:hypothetical protein